MRGWEGNDTLPREEKKTKNTGQADLKFMGSTEDKAACKYSVGASKN